MLYKIYFIQVKIVHFFIVNQDVVLVSLRKVILRTLCFSAAGANDLIERPVAFGRKLSILQPNECKILQLLNKIRKLTNSTRAYWIAGGFATWWRGAKCARTLVSVKPGRDAQVVTGCDSCCSYPPPSWWTSGSKWSKILLHLDGPALFFNAHCPLPDLAYLSFGHPKDRLQFL